MPYNLFVKTMIFVLNLNHTVITMHRYCRKQEFKKVDVKNTTFAWHFHLWTSVLKLVIQ